MGYLGVQSHGGDHRAQALTAVAEIVAHLDHPHGPSHHDVTHHVDREGYDNFIVVGYWADPQSCTRWLGSPEVDRWWSSDDRLTGPVGYFREIVSPRVDQFETLYAFQDRLPGVGALMSDISGDINEHGYWDRCANDSRCHRTSGCSRPATPLSGSCREILPPVDEWWSQVTTTSH